MKLTYIKYKFKEDENTYGLKQGDKVKGILESKTDIDILCLLPKRLHGTGHNGSVFNPKLKLKKNNYLYLLLSNLEEVEE